MAIKKEAKDVLTKDDILDYISSYESIEVPQYDKLWDYYIAKNPAIKNKRLLNANTPDNKIAVPYGRKIVTTFTGYAYRPKYITYKAKEERDVSEAEGIDKTLTAEERYVEELQKIFDKNNEHIKTSRAGRNIAIFGCAYEIVYVDGEQSATSTKAIPKFFSVDPREMILLYDYASEAKKKIAIRYYRITSNQYKVEVYYKDRIELYDRVRNDTSNEWELIDQGTLPNVFNDIPVVAYYFGDDQIGVIEPVVDLIDANDVLYSDSMNEFDKFATAYLIMKKYGLTDPTKVKSKGTPDNNLRRIKDTRVFEHLPSDAEIKFLTKDIPTGFIQFMSDKIREQIHIQSHVPDFTSEKMAGASGIAIQRLLFDFENVVSSVEADFDVGLIERIRLITIVMSKAQMATVEADAITITHKRNVPLNLQEFAQTALTMKQAGFSSYLCADIMPDDVIPAIQAELERQKVEQENMIGVDFEKENYSDIGKEEKNDINENRSEDTGNQET